MNTASHQECSHQYNNPISSIWGEQLILEPWYLHRGPPRSTPPRRNDGAPAGTPSPGAELVPKAGCSRQALFHLVPKLEATSSRGLPHDSQSTEEPQSRGRQMKSPLRCPRGGRAGWARSGPAGNAARTEKRRRLLPGPAARPAADTSRRRPRAGPGTAATSLPARPRPSPRGAARSGPACCAGTRGAVPERARRGRRAARKGADTRRRTRVAEGGRRRGRARAAEPRPRPWRPALLREERPWLLLPPPPHTLSGRRAVPHPARLCHFLLTLALSLSPSPRTRMVTGGGGGSRDCQ